MGPVVGQLHTLRHEALPPGQAYRRREPRPLPFLVGDDEERGLAGKILLQDVFFEFVERFGDPFEPGPSRAQWVERLP